MTSRNGLPPEANGRGTTSILAGEVTYAIGDIHGCYSLMVQLLDRIVADVSSSTGQQDETLVFLGDYIDRGPASSAVLTGLLWIERHSPLRTVFLKGNHEQVMLDYIDDPVLHGRWLQFGGSATLRSYGLEVPEEIGSIDHIELRDRFVDLLPSSHLDFLRRLQLFHETNNFIFAHAGIQHGLPMSKQEPEDLLWIREGFLEERSLRGKRVVHGHTWTSNKPEVLAHRIGVDTGAYETGVLTAAKLRGTTVEFITTANQSD
jgi:serine/threonine protein phosphatase 1